MPVTRRRRVRTDPGLTARRLAMFALFEDEFRPGTAGEALERLATERDVSDEVRAHAARIVAGVSDRRPDLDARIARQAPAIPVFELGRVERTILRSAV